MTWDVVVVGAGPVGLTVAAEMARFGLRVRIFDKNDRRTDKSKALVVWPRTLELIDRMAPDIAGKFIAAGLKVREASIRAADQEIGRLDLAHIDSPFNFVLMIAQSESERLLEDHLSTLGVRVERQSEWLDFVENPSGTVNQVRHPKGAVEEVHGSWLVGCDGAHSSIRHRLGMEFPGNTSPSHFILADVHLKGLEGPPRIHICWHAEGVLALFPLSATRYRVIADVGESPAASAGPNLSFEEIQGIVDRRGPSGIRLSDPVWISAFSINERMISNYRAGRVFLAGDAAHVHSPAGGQGMNTGMQDAFNLAWKLALVAPGLCPPEPLLSSYSAERSMVARTILAATGKATAVAVWQGGVAQSVRNHIAAWLLGLTPVRRSMSNVLSELSVGYPQSPLNGAAINSELPPGKRAPLPADGPPVGSGPTPRFALFAPAGLPADRLEKYGDILEPGVRSPFSSGGMWLVRPDGYVALATRAGDWHGIQAYLDRFSLHS
ncbi:MAG: FAD-dependent monooxygenase [Acidobacteria bacterium]|nr:FAD-dependent monooxygenase [Acidobacteriota bacterium]